MKSRVTVHTFNHLTRLEERMMRACMPKTSLRSPEPLVPPALRTSVATSRTLSFKLGEVAR